MPEVWDQARKRLWNITIADIRQSLKVRTEVRRVLSPDEIEDLEILGFEVREINRLGDGRRGCTISRGES